VTAPLLRAAWRRHLRLLTAASAVGAAAATAGIVAVHRRWGAGEDPTGGEPLCLPDGDDLTVTTRDGARLAVRVAGPEDGPVMVLLHGWTNDRRVWGAVAKRLVAAGHRVVLYDQRGHGDSTVGGDGLTMEALGADVEAVLDAVDATDAVLAGHSMGGMAAQAFAVNHQATLAQRVAALVIVSSACDRAGRHRFGLFVDRRIADWALAFSPLAPLLVRQSVGTKFNLDHLAAVRDLFVATPPPVRRQLRAAMVQMDFSGHVAAIPVPVTIVAGTRDQIVPFSRSRRIAELLPNAELKVLDDHGHMLVWEAPDELAGVLSAAASDTGA